MHVSRAARLRFNVGAVLIENAALDERAANDFCKRQCAVYQSAREDERFHCARLSAIIREDFMAAWLSCA